MSAPAAAEHRAATVAFLQFGGVDDLIAQRAPSAAASAIDELVGSAQDAADRYEVCFLNSDIAAAGGKLLFSAGAPRAAGDDEERMLLAMRQILESKPQLPVRIGVNRGYTFTGEVGPPYRRTYVVMGDVTNLAARLSAKAPWGSLYTLDYVLHRSRTRFARTAVPPFPVKGKLRPVAAVEVGPAIRAAQAGSATEPLPLIGRDRELAALAHGIAAAQTGRGTFVELIGETGSGKSRLVADARALGESMRVINVICEPYTRAIPYAGWREPLRQEIGLGRDDPDASVLKGLRARMQRLHPELLGWLPLLAIAFGVEAPATREVSELLPAFRNAKLHEVVLSFLEPALSTPTLLVFEHVDLMDEASAALLDALVDRLGRSSWAVIATRRDAAYRLAATEPTVMHIELEPLSPPAILALAEKTPEAHLIPPHVLQLAVERSAGNPGFLLDLLSAAAGGAQGLPDTVVAAASARIDALDPGDRQLIRRAAVLGLNFPPTRLRHVLPADAAVPGEDTWRRVSGMFVSDPDGQLRFKRPVLCEAAYDGLPFRLRRELHSAVGYALEADLGREVDADPAVLSLHFSRAGDYERAWRYARMGAERASARFAHADAAELHRRAIEAGRETGVTPNELATSFEALGDALQLSGQLPAASDALSAARRLLHGDQLAEARLFLRQGTIARRRADLRAAVRWALRGLRMLEGAQDAEGVALRAKLLAELAYIRHHQGRLREAAQLCRTAIDEAERVNEERALARALYVLDLVLFESGRAGETVHSGRALEIYERLEDLEQQGSVLNNLAFFAYFRWRWDEALDLYARSADCRTRAGNPAEVAQCESNIAEILCDRGAYDEAETRQRRAQRVWSSTGERAHAAYATALLGRLAVRTARYEEGLSLLMKASLELHLQGEKGYAEFAESLVAEGEAFGGDPNRALRLSDELLAASTRLQPLLHRVRGIALARLGDRRGALQALNNSVAIASEQGAEYELACGLDVLELLGPPEAERARERDAILARLRISELPKPRLSSLQLGREESRRPLRV